MPHPFDLIISNRFNIYILDYCRKRGYEKTAAELAHEADIPSDSQPPINAKQSLLFEYADQVFHLYPLTLDPVDGGAYSGFSLRLRAVAKAQKMRFCILKYVLG